MYQTIKVEDSVTVTVETRSTGRVRLGMTHPVVDLQRCEMTPMAALAIARALLEAGNTVARVHMSAVPDEQRAPVRKPEPVARISWPSVWTWGGLLALWAALAAVTIGQAAGW